MFWDSWGRIKRKTLSKIMLILLLIEVVYHVNVFVIKCSEILKMTSNKRQDPIKPSSFIFTIFPEYLKALNQFLIPFPVHVRCCFPGLLQFSSLTKTLSKRNETKEWKIMTTFFVLFPYFVPWNAFSWIFMCLWTNAVL